MSTTVNMGHDSPSGNKNNLVTKRKLLSSVPAGMLALARSRALANQSKGKNHNTGERRWILGYYKAQIQLVCI
jgi:hypothetical protein